MMRLVTGVLFLALLFGCNAQELTDIRVGEARFQVEVARTAEAWREGLMYRAELPAEQGMLFVYPQAIPVAFWMKNTYIPLDILYFDEQGRLQEIHADVPPCTTPECPVYPSTGPVQYVLEINASHAARLGLKPGDPLLLD